jgi:hypothetical protein
MALLYNPANESLHTREQLHDLPLPPALGRFHHPVPFGEYADLVAHRLERVGFEINAEEYAVDHDGQRLFGLLEVAPLEGEYISAKDWSLQVGLRGSHDQSVPRALTLGSRVLVCSNLCFHGDLGVFSTRQTTNIWQRLPSLVERALDTLPQLAQRNEQRFDQYRLTQINPRQGDAALVELHRRGALSSAQLGRAIAEWDEPTHEEHAEDGHSIWRLFNASTEALKPTGERVNHDLIRQRSERVSSFLDEVAGL